MTSSKLPKFQEIKRRLIADIEAGSFSPGERIASESELMRRHKVARMTVVRSLNDMVSEGYLVRLRGKGTFVRARPPANHSRSLSAYALVLPELRVGSYPSLVQSFEDGAREFNRQIVTCCTGNSVGKQGNAILQLIDNRVAGVALLPTTRGAPPVHHVRQLQVNGIPVVLLHRDVPGATAPLIAIEHDEIGRIAGKTFTSAGHRRVAFFATHAAPSVDAYIDGFRQSLQETGTDLESDLLHIGQRFEPVASPEHEAGIEAALRRLLKLPMRRRPTGIFSTWDPDAELIYLILGRLGIQIPQDVSLVSVGGAWRNNAITRRLTSVIIDEEYAGRAAAGLLDEMSSGRRGLEDDYRSNISLSLYEGQTLRRLR